MSAHSHRRPPREEEREVLRGRLDELRAEIDDIERRRSAIGE